VEGLPPTGTAGGPGLGPLWPASRVRTCNPARRRVRLVNHSIQLDTPSTPRSRILYLPSSNACIPSAPSPETASVSSSDLICSIIPGRLCAQSLQQQTNKHTRESLPPNTNPTTKATSRCARQARCRLRRLACHRSLDAERIPLPSSTVNVCHRPPSNDTNASRGPDLSGSHPYPPTTQPSLVQRPSRTPSR